MSPPNNDPSQLRKIELEHQWITKARDPFILSQINLPKILLLYFYPSRLSLELCYSKAHIFSHSYTPSVTYK